MEGVKRRAEIIKQLQKAQKPVSASKLAKEFAVSRQIIVGDIALLRASGTEILATARGYIMNGKETRLTAKIAVQHGPEQTEAELLTIVSFGAEVVDVIVEHDIYGEITGTLGIKNPADVANFMKRYQRSHTPLLSALTNGIHLHTISYDTPEVLNEIQEALKNKGLLYQE